MRVTTRAGQCARVTVAMAFAFVAFATLAADRFEESPINYSAATPNNPVSKLSDALATAKTELQFDPKFGYLKAVLAAFDIPIESQVLVFSKTSLQQQFISPEHPRAIFFNDETYVGCVQNGEHLEISTTDPALGTVFYTLAQRKTDRPELVRQSDNCLQCHASTLTSGVPGHIIRSLYTDAGGFPILRAGSFVTTQDSKFSERWGGWYVTGTHGAARHMGNAIATATEYDATLDTAKGANRTTLAELVDTENYLSGHSDLVALLVLEHQTQMHNLMTQANYETQYALRDQAALDDVLKPAEQTLRESTLRRIQSAGDKLVDYMLFANEARLESPVQGTSGFAERFVKKGPFDKQGRSLRQLDLTTRTFTYPLSYLIYSPQFDALPAEMKDYVYRRLWQVLTGADTAPRFAHFDAPTRQAIREILRETKKGLPDCWTPIE